MSINRFLLLTYHLRFEHSNIITSGFSQNRCVAIGKIFEKWNDNLAKVMAPSEFLALDETLYPMRHQIAFRHYIPNKPARYGVLFRSLNDSTYPYTYRCEIYAGKPLDGSGPHYIDPPTTDNCVKKIINGVLPYANVRGRNVSMDRCYGSITIANWLLEKNITVVATMNKIRIGLPEDLKSAKDREIHSKTLHFEKTQQQLALVTYTVKPKNKPKKKMSSFFQPVDLYLAKQSMTMQPNLL